MFDKGRKIPTIKPTSDMKYRLLLLLFFVLPSAFGQTKNIFLIAENDKIGYIDATGKVILQPQYKNGQDFSENLAPVRLNGKYGYIDPTGHFAIQPKYDFAAPFQNGIACVNLQGKPYFIDKNENVIIGKSYIGLAFISRNLAWVQTASRKKGIIDIQSKKLVADTVYHTLSDFDRGVAVVTKISDPENNDYDYAVIDTLGNYVVPLGRYEQIHSFVEGYARVQIIDKNNPDGSIDGVIDTKGKLLFERPYKDGSYISEDFHDGLAAVYLRKHPEAVDNFEDNYQGYINLKGEIVLNDTIYQYVKSFSGGRTFIEYPEDQYKLFDTNLKQVGTKTFDRVLNNSFANGYAVVQVGDKWGIIDVHGDFVVAPKFAEIHQAGVVGNFFFYTDTPGEEQLYGIATIDGKIITQPILQGFNQDGFEDGLLRSMVDNKLTYIDTSGKIVWQEQKTPKTKPVAWDIDYMNRGYFYAYSKSNEHDLGGYGGSRNVPKKIKNEGFPKGKLALTVNASAIDPGSKDYQSYSVNVSNLTKSEINFSAQDSRLYMVVQAKDADGQWKNIEYLPSSWCGNSYHLLTLEKNRYWTFQTPVYGGEYKTKLRISLQYLDPADQSKDRRERKELTVYSNEYEGGVNPAQFWNKRDYYPGGIMDPYND